MEPVLVPHDVGEVTAAWVTAALRESRALRRGHITSLTVDRFAEGVGLMSQVAQLSLDYAPGTTPGLPGTMVLKLAAPGGSNRAMALEYGLYEREVRFYRELAQRAGIRTPHPYVAKFEPASGDMVLLLEDLVTGQTRNVSAGVDDDDVFLIVRQLATFHARWWEGSGRPPPPWVPRLDGPVWASHATMFPTAWEMFAGTDRAIGRTDFLEFGAVLAASIPVLQARLCAAPVTLVHFDFRLSNLFVTRNAAAPAVAVVDWQPTTVARGPYDLGYFLGQSLPVAQRRRLEGEAVDLYGATLRSNGVHGYGQAELWEDYRLAVGYTASYAVGMVLVDLANDTGRSYADEVVVRSAAAVDDLDVIGLLRRTVPC